MMVERPLKRPAPRDPTTERVGYRFPDFAHMNVEEGFEWPEPPPEEPRRPAQFPDE